MELWAIEAKSALVMMGVPLGGAKLYGHATGEVLAYGLAAHLKKLGV